MLSLAGRYDTAVLVSGDEDFVYAVNAVAYKGCRVEIAGFRSNTAPKLIDVADCFIDLGEIADKVRKDFVHANRSDERELHYSQQPPPPAPFIEPVSAVQPCVTAGHDSIDETFHPPIGSIIEARTGEELAPFGDGIGVVRETEEQYGNRKLQPCLNERFPRPHAG